GRFAVDGREQGLGARGRRLAECSVDSRNRRLDAVEEAELTRRRIDDGRETFVIGERRTWLDTQAPAVLRPLIAEADAREILIRLAEHRIEAAGVNLDVPVLVLSNAPDVQLERLPRLEARGDLLRKHLR